MSERNISRGDWDEHVLCRLEIHAKSASDGVERVIRFGCRPKNGDCWKSWRTK